MIKIFGAPFDPLDMAERVDVKLAYLNWLEANRLCNDSCLDPYEFLEGALMRKNPSTNGVEWIGQFPVDSWLKPKPSFSDLERISQPRYTQFLDQNGCYDYYQKMVAYLSHNLGSSMPVMIGVDHCLTGSVLRYLKERLVDCHVLIFDSHCDLVDLETRRSYFGPYAKGQVDLFGERDVYECGSFLHYLLNNKILDPEKLWIMGTQDIDQFRRGAEGLYSQKILPWIKRGMHVLSKEDLIWSGIPEEIKGQVYISFDMDVGSLNSVFAARFLNYVGLSVEQIRGLINDLSRKMASKEIELVGLDIMEVDIHFLGETINGRKDYSGEIAKEIIEKLIYGQLNRDSLMERTGLSP